MSREYKPEFMDPENAGNNMPQAPGTAASVPSTSGLAGPAKQRKASSGFTNLKKYFQANQGNQLIQNVAQPAQQQLNQAQQTLAESQQKFNTQLENQKSQLQSAQEQAAKAKQYIDVGDKSLVGISALPQDATEEAKAKAALDANKAAQDALTKIRDYNYSGPRELENAAKIAQDQFAVEDFARATKTDAGRGALLQSVFGRGGQYTAGARGLDQFLLGADQSNLNKLRDIRAGAQKLGQNIRAIDTESAARVGGAQGNIEMAKDISRQEMQKLRDKKLADLEAEAAAYNAAQRADVANIDLEELKQWLPEMAGYDLTSAPLAPGEVAPTVVDPATQNYINLYQNRAFEPHQTVDPTRGLTRNIKEAGHAFHRDWTHTTTGRPNAQEAIVGLESLKPLFKENYQDNTWESINAEALERRNILSNVLADNAEKGLVTPKQRQEIQTQIDQDMLSKLKELPGMAEDVYTQSFFTNAPGSGDTGSTIQSYKQLGYNDPVSLMKDMNLDFRVDLRNLPGYSRTNVTAANMGGDVTTPYKKPGNQPLSTSDFEFNPATGKMRAKFLSPTNNLINPKTGEKVPIPTPENLGKAFPGLVSFQRGGVPNQTPEQIKELLIRRGFVQEQIQPPEIEPEKLLPAIVYGKGSFDNTSSPRLIAEKYQQKYLTDKLKEILGQQPEALKIKKV